MKTEIQLHSTIIIPEQLRLATEDTELSLYWSKAWPGLGPRQHE